ncbi:MAG: hypothetical protein ACOVMF_05515 [Aquiluna sp.]|jgi:hypothetical protein
MFSHGDKEINTQFNRVPKRLLIAIIVVSAESALIWGLTFWSLFALFSGDFLNLASAMFLTGILFAMALWTSNIAYGLYRFRKWSHTAGLVLQLIFAAVATASFSGEFAQPVIGFSLLVLAIICFVALFGGGIRELFHKAS